MDLRLRPTHAPKPKRPGLALRLALVATLALSLLLPGLALARSLEELDRILTQAKSVDEFLARPELVDRYYTALAEFFGAEKMPRHAYDGVITQLREVLPKVPGLKERLWETQGLGPKLSFTVAGRLGKPRLDPDGWAQFQKDWKNGLEKEAQAYLELPDATARAQKLRQELHALDERIQAALQSWEGLSSRARGAKASRFFKDLKQDPALQSALAYYTYSGLQEEPLQKAFESRSAELVLFHLDRLQKDPTALLASLPGDVELPSTLRSILAERMPKPEALAEAGIVTSPEPIPFKALSKPETWEFRPVPRRFHGIFKGIPVPECIGGDCARLPYLLPERWATIALKNSQLQLPFRDGKYAGGFLHSIPIQVEGKTYRSLDMMSAVLAQNVLVEDPPGSGLRPQSLLRRWYTEATKALPKGSRGLVVADSEFVNNAGLAQAIRSTSVFVNGQSLGPAAGNVVTLDRAMEQKLLNWVPKKGTAADYDHGRMVFETSVPMANRLTLLAPPDGDPPLLDDPEWVRSVIQHSDFDKTVRLYMAFDGKEPSPQVNRALKMGYDDIRLTLSASPSFFPDYETLHKILPLMNVSAVRGLHRVGYRPARDADEFLAYFQFWHRAGHGTSLPLEQLQNGTASFMDAVADRDFFRFEPTPIQLRRAMNLDQFQEFRYKVRERLASRALSPREYIELVQYQRREPHLSEQELMNNLVNRTLDHFLAMKPTDEEILDLFFQLGPEVKTTPPSALLRMVTDSCAARFKRLP